MAEKINYETEEKILTRGAVPIQEYLKNNRHPHTVVIITEDRVAVMETVHSIPTIS